MHLEKVKYQIHVIIEREGEEHSEAKANAVFRLNISQNYTEATRT